MATLQDRAFLITGGGGAIARPIVRAFAGAGARVAVVDRTLEHARDAAAEVNGVPIGADLTTPAGADAMVARAIETLGRVDGVIHTVGGFSMGKVHEVAPADYDRMFDLNVRSLFYVARSLLPGMLARKEGFLAAFSSEPGWTGAAPGMSLYAAAKSAAATFLRSLDGELTGTQIRVAIVYPMGAVDTPANRRDMPAFDVDRYIDPDEIAQALLHAATRGPRARLTELPIWPAR
jgi:NADP-dependent 3-hydroxy acid dehydrogenase YdfG